MNYARPIGSGSPGFRERGTASVLVVFLASFVVWTAQGQNFAIEQAVFSVGGDTSSDVRYVLTGSIGQPAIETSQGGGFGVASGFWNAILPTGIESLAAPSGLTALINGNGATVNWNAVAGDEVWPGSISYRLRVGSSPGGSEVVSPGSSSGSFLTPTDLHGLSAVLTNLSLGQTCFWSVQAVDVDLVESAFAPEVQFFVSAGGGVTHAPRAVNDSLERPPGKSVKVLAAKLVANDFDLDGDGLALLPPAGAWTSTNGGTVTLDSGWVIYSPPVTGLTNAADAFAYVVTDTQGNTAVGQVEVIVAVPADTQGPNAISITVSASGNGAIDMTFIGIRLRNYAIQATETLAPPQWVTLVTLQAGPTGFIRWTDSDAGSHATRYYRITAP